MRRGISKGSKVGFAVVAQRAEPWQSIISFGPGELGEEYGLTGIENV